MAGYTYDQILALTRQAGYQGQQATGIATSLYNNQTANVTQADKQQDPLGSYLGQQFTRGAKLGLGLLAGGIALFVLLAGPAISGGQKASQFVGPAAGVESIRASRATRALRTRQLQDLNAPPQGGTPTDGTPTAQPRSTRGQLLNQPYGYGRQFGAQRASATPRGPKPPDVLSPEARAWAVYQRAQINERSARNRNRPVPKNYNVEAKRQAWLAIATPDDRRARGYVEPRAAPITRPLPPPTARGIARAERPTSAQMRKIRAQDAEEKRLREELRKANEASFSDPSDKDKATAAYDARNALRDYRTRRGKH